MDIKETLLAGKVHTGCIEAGYDNASAVREARSAVTAWRARGTDDTTAISDFANDWLKFINGDSA